MKKLCFYSTAVLLSLAGCLKTDPAVEVTPDSQDVEMSFSALTRGNAVSGAMTRGFVTGTEEFKDIADPSVTGSDGPYRTIRLSAWNSVKESDYFIDKKFAKGTTDEYWHAAPKIYYPLGCGVDLLGYSAGDTIVADWQSAHVVKLQVANTQDDVLYSGTTASSIHPTPTMIFRHSQAWIQFRLTANIPDAVRVDSIYWESIYDRGELRLEFDAEHPAEPKADWNFFTQDLCNVAVDDTTHKLDATMLSSTAIELNMLLPEQAHTSFVILYTLKNGTGTGKQFAYRVKTSSLATTAWERSHRYTYTVNFEMSGITLAPTVKLWVEETIDRINSVEVVTGGRFSVSASKQVAFSKGNLQYRPSDSTWRFAEHQWDFVGGDMPSVLPPSGFLPATTHIGSVKNSTNTPLASSGTPLTDAERRSYDGWIDLFGWGTSNRDPGNGNKYQPWLTAAGDYGPDGDLDAAHDWGANVRVFEYQNRKWRFNTLTAAEWTYLLDTRTTDSGHRWFTGTLVWGFDSGTSVGGLFILPDHFVWKEHFGPEPTAFYENTNPGYTVDNTVGGRFDALENAGVVFIPFAGYREGTDFRYAGTAPVGYGLYLWTSTSSGTGQAKSLVVRPGEVCGVTDKGGHLGYSVRLATDLSVSPTYPVSGLVFDGSLAEDGGGNI